MKDRRSSFAPNLFRPSLFDMFRVLGLNVLTRYLKLYVKLKHGRCNMAGYIALVARFAVLLLGLWLPCAASAQLYPDRPITLIVPTAAGGVTDSVARIVARNLQNKLGQEVVIQNRSDEAGAVGYQEVAAAKPDGYTLLFSDFATLFATPTKVISETGKSYKGVAPATAVSMMMVAHPSIPAPFGSVKELVDFAVKNPGMLKISLGAPGLNSQRVAEKFLSLARIQVARSFAPSGVPPHVDVIGGQAQFAFEAAKELMPLVKTNRLRALAVLNKSRDPMLPEVPTMDESGYPGLALPTFTFVLAPAGTPDQIIEKLNSAMNVGLQASDVKSELSNLSAEPLGGSPKDLTQMIQTEAARWNPGGKT
jgi:tripartite-type tricarboxylate transporter receptor subunit TctC